MSLFLRLTAAPGSPDATERIITVLTAALAAAVAASLGLGLGLAIALGRPTPQHPSDTVVPGAERLGAAGSSTDGPVRLIPSAGSMAAPGTTAPGTTLAIPPLSGTKRSVTVTDTVSGAVLAGELSGDATTWHSTAVLVAGRSYRVTVASTRSDGVVTVTDTTITSGR